jgi:hypothetical protein
MGPLLALDERQTQAQGSKGQGNWWEKLLGGFSAHGDLQLMIITRSLECLEACATILELLGVCNLDVVACPRHFAA